MTTSETVQEMRSDTETKVDPGKEWFAYDLRTNPCSAQIFGPDKTLSNPLTNVQSSGKKLTDGSQIKFGETLFSLEEGKASHNNNGSAFDHDTQRAMIVSKQTANTESNCCAKANLLNSSTPIAPTDAATKPRRENRHHRRRLPTHAKETPSAKPFAKRKREDCKSDSSASLGSGERPIARRKTGKAVAETEIFVGKKKADEHSTTLQTDVPSFSDNEEENCIMFSQSKGNKVISIVSESDSTMDKNEDVGECKNVAGQPHGYWDKFWEEKYDQLVSYKAEHNGSTDVHSRSGTLGRWVSKQRHYYKNGKLAKERIALLEAIGFQWQLKEGQEHMDWREMYDQLVAHKAKHDGSTYVCSKSGSLGRWVAKQRHYYKTGKLRKERIDLLESIGFLWQYDSCPQPRSCHGGPWKDMYDELVAYAEQHGGATNVNTKSGKLGSWVGKQRQNFKKGDLTKEKIDMLESIGFQWQLNGVLHEGSRNEKWNEMYDQLLSYGANHNGSTNVPQKFGKLGKWVDTQRQTYKKGKLAKERIDMLESIGFEWERYEHTAWAKMFNQLVSYMDQNNGSTNVPATHGKLASWVSKQRDAFKKGTLAMKKIKMLDSIDFQWQSKDSPTDEDSAEIRTNEDWVGMYTELVLYNAQHNGSTSTLSKSNELRSWMEKQRAAYESGKLTKEKIAMLESAGFQWKVPGLVDQIRKKLQQRMPYTK